MDSSSANRLYTTHEVARLLGVTPITVIRWIESGRFKCYTTVGGHRRVDHAELLKFAQAYNLPWREDEEVAERKEFIVLEVDDEPDMLDMVHDILLSLPLVKMIGVTNAFSAGAKLVEEHPDLILLDVLMPELDGFEFARFVRQDPRFRTIPIVAVTGLKNETDKARMMRSGMSEVLFKPFRPQDLIGMIERFRLLKKHAKGAGHDQEDSREVA